MRFFREVELIRSGNGTAESKPICINVDSIETVRPYYMHGGKKGEIAYALVTHGKGEFEYLLNRKYDDFVNWLCSERRL